MGVCVYSGSMLSSTCAITCVRFVLRAFEQRRTNKRRMPYAHALVHERTQDNLRQYVNALKPCIDLQQNL